MSRFRLKIRVYLEGIEVMEKNDWHVSVALSVEALRGDISALREMDLSNEGLATTLTNLFRNTYNTLRVSISGFLDKNDYGVLKLDENLVRKLDKSKLSKNYAYLLDTQVEVPVGMKGHYLPYTEVSLKLSTLFSGLQSQVEKLRSDIGRVISTEKGLLDSTLFDDKYYLEENKVVKNTIKEWSLHRVANDIVPSRAFGDVFRNGNELVECIGVARQCNDNLNQVNRKKLIANIETTMTYVKDLMEAAKEGYSKPLMLKIANAVAAVADNVETLSAAVYNTKMLNVALDSVNEKITSLVN